MDSSLLLRALFSGIMFGAWPLLISKSGLSGSSATLIGVIVSFCVVAPFALANGVIIAGTKWWIIIITGTMGGLGVLVFNDMMIKAKPGSSALLFVIMLVVQIMVPAVLHLVADHNFSIKTIAGFIAAVVACILLSYK